MMHQAGFMADAVDKAAELGLLIGMLPTWGDKWNRMWAGGPEIFTPENAFAYGEFLGRRDRHGRKGTVVDGDERCEIVRAVRADVDGHRFRVAALRIRVSLRC